VQGAPHLLDNGPEPQFHSPAANDKRRLIRIERNEGHILIILLGVHAQGIWGIGLVLQPKDGIEQFDEVSVNHLRIVTVGQDVQQISGRDEVEAWKGQSLGL